MDPNLLALLQREMSRLANSTAAQSSALSAMAQVLQAASTSAGASIKGLGRSVGNASDKLDDLAESFDASANSSYKLAKGILNLVASHFQMAASMIRLNRTIYETEDVFANMGSKVTAGLENLERVGSSLNTLIGTLPYFGRLAEKTLSAGGKVLMDITKEMFEQTSAALKGVDSGFREASNAAGFVATNMDKFSEMAAQAGMNSQIFGRLLAKTSSDLIVGFGSIQAGAERLSSIMSKMLKPGDQLMVQFRNLGLNVDEVAEAIADYRALEARSGSKKLMTDEELATSTYKYIANLRVLQSITGEDIKTQRAAREKLMTEGSFRAQLQLMQASDKEAEKRSTMIMQLMQMVGQDVGLLYGKQRFAGQVPTGEAALAASLAPELFKVIEGLADIAKVPITTEEAFQRAAQLIEKNQDALKAAAETGARSGLAQLSLSAPGSEPLKLVASTQVSLLDFVKNIDKTIEALKKGARPLTEEAGKISQLLVDEEKRQFDTRKKFENMMLGPNGLLDTLNQFLQRMKEVQENLTNLYLGIAQGGAKTMLKGAGLAAVAQDPIGLRNAIGEFLDQMNKTAEDQNLISGTQKVLTDKISELTRRLEDPQVAAEERKKLTEEIRRLREELQKPQTMERISHAISLPGGADGNVISGPKSGYYAVLHGIEAVVPLPDGRTIPVSLDTSNLEATMRDLTDRISSQPNTIASADLTRYLEANNEITRELLRELRRGNEISDKMFKAVA